MQYKIPDRAPRIVLVEPQMGENIGGAARAMMNCGLRALTLVNPRDGWPNPKAEAMSAHARGIIAETRVVARLPEALADCHWVLATTARGRDLNKPVLTPRQAAEACWQRRLAGQQVAVLFGRESVGLSNEELGQANAILTVPLDPANTSLNLAQAVLLFGYEWYQQVLASGEGAAEVSDLRDDGTRRYRLPATAGELENFLTRLIAELDSSGFLGVPEKRDRMVQNIRALFLRSDLSTQEVQTLHGIVKFLRQAPPG